MRVEHGVEGLLILATLVFADLRPTCVASVLFALQVVSPYASPFAIVWTFLDRKQRPHRLGDIYYDMAGVRGASAIALVVSVLALLLIRAGVPVAGQLLLGAQCASCLLAATTGFCAGIGHYVLGRDLIVHRMPEGAADVQLSDVDQRQMPASS